MNEQRRNGDREERIREKNGENRVMSDGERKEETDRNGEIVESLLTGR